MSLRLEMVQVARLAPKILGDATSLVVDFLNSQRRPDGGFCDRGGQSDLYYTVFGIEGLLALQQPLPFEDIYRYITTFGDGQGLDFIHVACLARCWSTLPADMQRDCPVDAIVARLDAGRTPDGGFSAVPGKSDGSMYGAFMAIGAYQDLKEPIPQLEKLLEFVCRLRDPNGAFQQSKELPVSLVPATAGAISLLRSLGNQTVDPSIGDWFLSCFDPQGGFRPAPIAPVPDLLSSSTTHHALSSMKIDLGERKELCLDFIDTLWTNRGGFYGHWDDSHADCEYTYYALLSLGHLSL